MPNDEGAALLGGLIGVLILGFVGGWITKLLVRSVGQKEVSFWAAFATIIIARVVNFVNQLVLVTALPPGVLAENPLFDDLLLLPIAIAVLAGLITMRHEVRFSRSLAISLLAVIAMQVTRELVLVLAMLVLF